MMCVYIVNIDILVAKAIVIDRMFRNTSNNAINNSVFHAYNLMQGQNLEISESAGQKCKVNLSILDSYSYRDNYNGHHYLS